uniref:Protein quiver n=1 Tax=Romanomermis culicivorax TaxID=13658 RepID=A0A915JBC3_ROMCU
MIRFGRQFSIAAALLTIALIISFFGRLLAADVETMDKDSDQSKDPAMCYYCASPDTNLPEIKRKVLLMSFNIYRHIPEFRTEECDQLTNATLLQTQECSSGYCLKHIVDDKDGSPFVLRGCVDDLSTAQRSSYKQECTKISLDWITEACVCKGSLCNGTQFNNLSRNLNFVSLFVIFLLLYYVFL